MYAYSSTLVLIPAFSHMDWRLSDSLRRMRISYLQVHGCSDLVRARSRLLSDGMKTDADTFIFIDADITATPDQIAQLIESPMLSDTSAVSGCYLAREGCIAAVPLEPGAIEIGAETRFQRLMVAGMGFAAVKRAAIEKIRAAEPEVTDFYGERWSPYFLPFILEFTHDTGESVREYVPEDYSFWWRLRTQAHADLWLDTHLAVGHAKGTVLIPQGVVGSLADASAPKT